MLLFEKTTRTHIYFHAALLGMFGDVKLGQQWGLYRRHTVGGFYLLSHALVWHQISWRLIYIHI